MMKKAIFPVLLLFAVLSSCEDDEGNLFDKSADERAAEAIAALKQDLVAPQHGWIVKYKPEEGAGSYYVLLDFQENNKVVIQTDLGAEDGTYFDQTISYRIDNSLGLELIFENYSFFSFLFEQQSATFGAEFEFDYVNKTPDNALVFRSKTDVGQKSIIVLEQASVDDKDLLGVTLASNLSTIADDLDKFTSSLKLTYNTRNLALYISLDELSRTITITSASLKTSTATAQSVNFTSGYLVEADKIILEDAFTGTILGNPITIEHLTLTALGESTLDVCADPIDIHTFSGFTSAGDAIELETSVVDVSGSSFAQLSDIYFTPLEYIFNNGTSMAQEIPQNVAGAVQMVMYYNYDIGGGDILNGIGFIIENLDGTYTIAVREFTPVLNGNNLVFNFAPGFTLFNNPETDANVNNINIYLDALTNGGDTYVFSLEPDVYEFYNPCTGWSFIFINAN